MRKIYDVKKLPDGRGRVRKYPWGELDKIGACFYWNDIEDRNSMYASAKAQKMKVAIRLDGDHLVVIRTE